MEAAETIEEAVRREAFEETGITIDRVAYHSSQPWVKKKLGIIFILSHFVSNHTFTAFSQLPYAWIYG